MSPSGHCCRPASRETRRLPPNSRRADAYRSGRLGQFDQSAAQQNSAYSITSSARPSSIGGTSMPIAFAVLRLMINKNLVGKATGRSAGCALEYLVDVDRALASQRRIIRTVRRQRSSEGPTEWMSMSASDVYR